MLVQEDIRDQWDRVKPGLYWIHSNLNPEWRPEDIYMAVRMGAATLWMDPQVEDGFAILQVKPDAFKDIKALLVWVAYYQGGDGVSEYLPEIEKMARDFGCQRVEFWSPRRGFERLAEKAGYKIANVVYARDI